jgi:hypothetical protein
MEKEVFAKCEGEYSRDMKIMTAQEKKKKFSYEAERNQVMKALGYDTPGIMPPVRKPKYHGKAVRAAGFASSLEENRLRRERDEKIKLVHRKLDLTIVQASCIQDSINSVKESIAKNRLIPKNLLPKMSSQIKKVVDLSADPDNSPINVDALEKAANNSLSSMQSLHSIPVGFVQKDGMLMLKETASACPVRIMKPISNYGKGFEREKQETSFSKHLWTREERDRLNELYLSSEKPASNHPSSWNGFYRSTARLFMVYFPKRKEDEVMHKLHDMLCRNSLIVEGEQEYWAKYKKKYPRDLEEVDVNAGSFLAGNPNSPRGVEARARKAVNYRDRGDGFESF